MICLSTGKLAFRSPGDAERRRKAIKRKRGAKSPPLAVYKCACGKRHLGHSESWQRRQTLRPAAT